MRSTQPAWGASKRGPACWIGRRRNARIDDGGAAYRRCCRSIHGRNTGHHGRSLVSENTGAGLGTFVSSLRCRGQFALHRSDRTSAIFGRSRTPVAQSCVLANGEPIEHNSRESGTRGALHPAHSRLVVGSCRTTGRACLRRYGGIEPGRPSNTIADTRFGFDGVDLFGCRSVWRSGRLDWAGGTAHGSLTSGQQYANVDTRVGIVWFDCDAARRHLMPQYECGRDSTGGGDGHCGRAIVRLVAQTTNDSGGVLVDKLMQEPILVAQGLGYSYPGHMVFRGLDLRFRRGQLVALLGPNGAGKTTLLRCLCKLLKPTTGMVRSTVTIGYVPQTSELNAPYSVFQVVAMGRATRSGLFGSLNESDHAVIAQAVQWCELEPLIQRTFTTLSGGERQRVLVARALAQAADILVLDEPMAAMDLRHQVQLLALLNRLVEKMNKLIIFSTHQPQHALSVASHSMLIAADCPIKWGSSEDVLTEQGLENCLGVPVRLVQIPMKERIGCYVVSLI